MHNNRRFESIVLYSFTAKKHDKHSKPDPPPLLINCTIMPFDSITYGSFNIIILYFYFNIYERLTLISMLTIVNDNYNEILTHLLLYNSSSGIHKALAMRLV